MGFAQGRVRGARMPRGASQPLPPTAAGPTHPPTPVPCVTHPCALRNRTRACWPPRWTAWWRFCRRPTSCPPTRRARWSWTSGGGRPLGRLGFIYRSGAGAAPVVQRLWSMGMGGALGEAGPQVGHERWLASFVSNAALGALRAAARWRYARRRQCRGRPGPAPARRHRAAALPASWRRPLLLTTRAPLLPLPSPAPPSPLQRAVPRRGVGAVRIRHRAAAHGAAAHALLLPPAGADTRGLGLGTGRLGWAAPAAAAAGARVLRARRLGSRRRRWLGCSTWPSCRVGVPPVNFPFPRCPIPLAAGGFGLRSVWRGGGGLRGAAQRSAGASQYPANPGPSSSSPSSSFTRLRFIRAARRRGRAFHVVSTRLPHPWPAPAARRPNIKTKNACL